MRTVKEIWAGPYYRACDSVVLRPHSSTRGGRASPTEDYRQRLNDNGSCDKLEFLLLENFTLQDLFVTVTYTDEHLPLNYKAAATRLRWFWTLYRDRRKRLALPKDYVYVIEGEHGDHRMHHHFVVRSDGGNREVLRSLWKWGGCHIETIEEFGRKGYRSKALDLTDYVAAFGDEKGKGLYEIECFRRVARYMTKEPRKTGRARPQARMYTPSRGLRQPIVRTYDVEAGENYSLPDNVVQLSAERKDNAFGEFGYTTGWAKNRTSLNNFSLKQSINNRE